MGERASLVKRTKTFSITAVSITPLGITISMLHSDKIPKEVALSKMSSWKSAGMAEICKNSPLK